jgi:hypothetical protein
MNYGRYGRELLLELKRGDDRLDSSSVNLADVSDTTAVAGDSGSSSAGAAPLLPPYNDELVTNCLQDLRLHVQALHDQAAAAAYMSSSGGTRNKTNAAAASSSTSSVSVSMQVRPNIVLQSSAIDRNKRCLLAYHVGRIERIKPYYWTSMWETTTAAAGSASTPSSFGSGRAGQGTKNTCPAEEDFLRDYSSLVQQYTVALGLQPDDLRACGSSVPLPTDKVQVRVVVPPPGSFSYSSSAASGEGEGRNTATASRSCQGIVLDSGASVVFSPGSTHFLLWDDVEEYVRLGYLQVLEGEEHLG